MIFLKVAVAVLVILALGVVALRVRKVRIDELRRSEPPLDPRLVVPPPSPYQRAAGFRVLDEDGERPRREPERPRLDQEKQYVFSDAQILGPDDFVTAPKSHDEKWALERSEHRGTKLYVPLTIASVTLCAAVAVVWFLVSGKS